MIGWLIPLEPLLPLFALEWLRARKNTVSRIIKLVLLLLLTTPAWGQIAFVQTTDVASANPAAISITTGAFASAVTSGRLLVAYVAWNNDVTASLTDTAGNTWVSGHARINETGQIAQPFYAKNVTGGSSFTVTATFSADATFRKIQASEYSGLDTTAPLDVTAGSSNPASANPTSGTNTSTVADTLIVGGVSVSSGTGDPAAGTNFTLRSTQNFFAMEDRIVSATGTYEANWTYASTKWVAHMMIFKIQQTVASTGKLGGTAKIGGTAVLK